MQKRKSFFGVIVFLTFFFTTVFAETQNSPNSQGICVDFRFVCENQNQDCDKFVIDDSKEELCLEKQVQLSINDIQRAQAIIAPGYNQQQDNRKSLILKGKEQKAEPPASILFKFTEQAKQKLAQLTSKNIRRRLGIVINGRLIMAPRIYEPITGGEVEVAGKMTKKFAEDLAYRVNVLVKFRQQEINSRK